MTVFPDLARDVKSGNAAKKSGKIFSIQSKIAKELENSDPMARAIAYAKNGIWYDTISTLAQMRRQAPEDATLTAEWEKLLKSQKLDAIATQPLVQSF